MLRSWSLDELRVSSRIKYYARVRAKGQIIIIIIIIIAVIILEVRP